MPATSAVFIRGNLLYAEFTLFKIEVSTPPFRSTDRLRKSAQSRK
jgi:hypothetical protein